MPTDEERREVAERLYGLPAGELSWPALSEAVLGRRAQRSEVVGRIAELLEEGAIARGDYRDPEGFLFTDVEFS